MREKCLSEQTFPQNNLNDRNNEYIKASINIIFCIYSMLLNICLFTVIYRKPNTVQTNINFESLNIKTSWLSGRAQGLASEKSIFGYVFNPLLG